MKTKSFLCYAIPLLVTVSVFAQVPGQPPPAAAPPQPPQGPLIAKRAPEFARWTIAYKYKGEGEKEPRQRQPSPEEAQLEASDPVKAFTLAPPRVLARTFIKTGNVLRIVTNYERGKLEDRWIIEGVHITRTPAYREIMIGANSFDGTDLDVKDS